MANQANKQAAVSEQGCSGVLTSIGTMRAESAVVAKTGSISSIMERCAGIFLSSAVAWAWSFICCIHTNSKVCFYVFFGEEKIGVNIGARTPPGFCFPRLFRERFVAGGRGRVGIVWTMTGKLNAAKRSWPRYSQKKCCVSAMVRASSVDQD